MNVVIRVDASRIIGTGHVMRCLSLAEMLSQRGAIVTFLCRLVEGNMLQYIVTQGFTIIELPFEGDDAPLTMSSLIAMGGVDWLVIDHYEIDVIWEQQMRPYASKIMVIDDLANRRHDCDLLLDQNYYELPAVRYSGIVPSDCRLFIGPTYSLLRSEFVEAKKALEHVEQETKDKSLERTASSNVCKVLVFFSGSDPTDETRKALRALAIDEFSRMNIDVVVGASNPHGELIQEMCMQNANFYFHNQINYMARLMLSADLAIGACGTATWERCYLRLPTISIVLAENQKEIAAIASRAGIVCNLGWYADVCEETIRASVRSYIAEPEQLAVMREACGRLIPRYDILQLIDFMWWGAYERK